MKCTPKRNILNTAILAVVLVSLMSAASYSQPNTLSIDVGQLGTSFDCSGSRQNVPTLVCNDPDLRVADLQQMQAYYALRHTMPNLQQELRTQFLGRVQALVRECSAETVRASGNQKQCIARGLSEMRNTWLTQLRQTNNAAAIEEALLDISQLISVQNSLKSSGLLPASSTIDGVYGNMTRGALTRLQADRNISEHGFANADTVRSLLGSYNPASSPSPSNTTVQTSPSRQNVLPATSRTAQLDAETQAQLNEAGSTTRTGDYVKALSIYRPLAERGVAQAQGAMADFLYNGWGLPRNELEAIRWARSGAEQNDPRSLNFLGFCHSGWAQGCTGISQNFATSATFFRRAAIQGLASAQRNLGFMYLNGHGVTRNDNEAFRFFQLAAQQRDAQAEFFLGVMHEEGRGVSPDRNQAFRWYQRAAEQGNTNAQQRLVQDRPFMIARAREAAAAQERGDYEGALSIYRDLERIYAEAVRRTTYTNTDEHLSLSLVRANIAQIENNQRLLLVRPSYQTRTKSVLEQILNFTTTGVLEGSEKHFWISGHENTHKCILTPFSAVSSSTLTPVDVRTFNQTAFQFNVRGSCDAGGRNSVTVRVGDETNAVTAIYGPLSSIGASCDKAPSMERLQRAWELAFRECPGRRSAF